MSREWKPLVVAARIFRLGSERIGVAPVINPVTRDSARRKWAAVARTGKGLEPIAMQAHFHSEGNT